MAFHQSFRVQGVIMKESDALRDEPPFRWLTDADHEQLDVPESAHPRSHHRHPDMTFATPPSRLSLHFLALVEQQEREQALAREQPAITEPVPDPVPPAVPDKPRRQPSRLQQFVSRRAMAGWSTRGPASDFMASSEGFWDFLLNKYFRVHTTGWERVPEGGCLIVGVHAGTWLTMDAWMLMADWWFRFREKRILHGTAHDVLMAMPGIGTLFRRVGVVPACRESVGACLAAGHSVVIWPGGEVDSMRSWRKRHQVVLDGRKGFVRQAIRSGVPIVPVATVGGADTVFVLSEGRWLARTLHLKQFLRSETAPIVAGLPFGIWLEAFPSHIPLPSKICNEFLEPLQVEAGRENDEAYVESVYCEVERRIQEGVHRLAKARRLPLIG
jgi:1-acyl-sn-glycerol-3-phosphate acyltransferase